MLKEVLDIVAQGGPVGIAGVVLWFHLNAVKRYEKQLEEEPVFSCCRYSEFFVILEVPLLPIVDHKSFGGKEV